MPPTGSQPDQDKLTRQRAVDENGFSIDMPDAAPVMTEVSDGDLDGFGG
jgi:hypothetical protein